MANPQIEDGYIKIATELFKALARIRINGEARQVLDVIFWKTYGFNKKEDAISMSQFMQLTGIKTRPNIVRAIKKLETMNIVCIQKDTPIATTYSIQKDYDDWRGVSKRIHVSKRIQKCIQKDTEGVSKRIHTKDTLTKDTIQKTVEKRKSCFTTPTLLDVKNYCKDRNNSVCPEKFVNFYQSKGWMIGKNKMKDWMACVRTWEQGDKGPQQKPGRRQLDIESDRTDAYLESLKVEP